MRKTKIVATMGPATDSPEMIENLILAGVNVFRFNFSHNTHEYHLANLQKVREISKRLKKAVAVLQDISGPKIRIGDVAGTMSLQSGDNLTFYKEAGFSDDKGVIINYPQILASIKVGDLIYLADGSIRTEAIEASPEKVVTKVIVGGNLTSKKGVNFPQTVLNISPITEKDKKDIEFGVKNGVDMMAISFVKNKADVLEAKEIIASFGGKTPVFPKIEKPEAVKNLDDIVEVSDGLMVARGDLGVEFGLSKVPAAQKTIIKKANFAGKPVITATQMLTSMINSPFPTRAEVSDVANAIMDGTDAVMLSDETTIGKFPIEAIKVLDETAREIETIYPYYAHLEDVHLKSDAVSTAANRLAEDINADAIICFTQTGKSARSISKYRPHCPIIVAVHSDEVYRQLAIVWGVEPTVILDEHDNTDEMVHEFTMKALEEGSLKEDGTYIMTVGYPIGKADGTNLIRIMKKEDIENMRQHAAKCGV